MQFGQVKKSIFLPGRYKPYIPQFMFKTGIFLQNLKKKLFSTLEFKTSPLMQSPLI
jgi:hypothetical protein